MRATLDTVAVLPHMLGRRPSLIDYWIDEAAFEFVCSVPLLEEYERKLLDLKVRRTAGKRGYSWSNAQVTRLIDLIASNAEFVVPAATSIPSDSKDEVVLGTAVAGSVDALVTFDKVFREDEQAVATLSAHSIALLTVPEFLRLLRDRDLIH